MSTIRGVVPAGEGREQAGHPDFGRLPAGRHGLSPAQVAGSQRERALAAVATVVAERGYGEATIAAIVTAASISTRSFYELFDSKEDAFLETFDAVVAHIRALVSDAVDPGMPWAEQMLAGLRALVGFCAAEPDLVRFCLLEPPAAGPRVTARFRTAVASCAPYLRAGRAEREAGAPPLPESTEDSLLGGVVSMLSESILLAPPPSELLPDLIRFVLSPYLGPERTGRLAAAG